MRFSPILVVCFSVLQVVGPPESLAQPGDTRPGFLIVSNTRCCEQNAWPEAEAKTRLELSYLNFRIVTIDPHEPIGQWSQARLANLVLEHNALGAVRISRLDNLTKVSVELFVNNSRNAKTQNRNFEMEEIIGAHAHTILALRVVESLRTCLQQVGLSHALPGEESYVEVEDFSIGLGPVGLWSPGLSGAGGGADFFVRLGLTQTLSLEAHGLLVFLSDKVSSDLGQVSVGLFAIQAWMFWTVFSRESLRAELGVGGGILIPWSQAHNSPQLTNIVATTTSAYVGACPRIAYRLGQLWFVLALRVGLPIPSIRIYLGDTKIAQEKGPLTELGLALAVAFD